MGNKGDQKIEELGQKLRAWRVTSLILFIVLIMLSGKPLVRVISECPTGLSFIKADAGAPYKKEVLEIIKPLRYSGIQAFMRQDVWMSMDFPNGIWTLQNLYRFDADGRVLLEEGRYGLCGELARYVYQNIKPLFGDKYNIEFVHVSETGYFPNPKSSHVVLRITEQNSFLTRGLLEAAIYILDPSFGRYGNIDQFEDYLFLDTIDVEPMMDRIRKNGHFAVNGGFPIIISKNSLLHVVVEQNNGKFDRNNFVISLSAAKRHRYAGRYVFALRNNEGKSEVLENKALAKSLLDKAAYQKLRDKLTQIFNRLTEQSE